MFLEGIIHLRYHQHLTIFGAGVALGGGLFLVVLIIGVLVWISQEKVEDQEIRQVAEKLQGMYIQSSV